MNIDKLYQKDEVIQMKKIVLGLLFSVLFISGCSDQTRNDSGSNESSSSSTVTVSSSKVEASQEKQQQEKEAEEKQKKEAEEAAQKAAEEAAVKEQAEKEAAALQEVQNNQQNNSAYTTNGEWTVAADGMVFVSDSGKYYSSVTNPSNYQYMSQIDADNAGYSRAQRGNQYARP